MEIFGAFDPPRGGGGVKRKSPTRPCGALKHPRKAGLGPHTSFMAGVCGENGAGTSGGARGSNSLNGPPPIREWPSRFVRPIAPSPPHSTMQHTYRKVTGGVGMVLAARWTSAGPFR